MRRFTLSFGLSLADIEVPAETLYAENRGIIDATTVRRAFVEDPVRGEVDAYPAGLGRASRATQPDPDALGRREVVAGPSFYLSRADVVRFAGAEIRLKDLVNIQLPGEVPADAPTRSARFTSRENRKIPRVQGGGAEGAVPVDLLGLEGEHRRGMGETALAEARPRDIYQFERVGFVRVDGDWRPGSTPVRVVFGHPCRGAGGLPATSLNTRPTIHTA